LVLVRNKRRPLSRLAIFVAAIGLFLLGYYGGNWYKLRNAGPLHIEGVLLRPAQEVARFELNDATGLPFTAKDLRDHWTLLAFARLDQARGHLAITRMIDVYNRLADQRDLHKAIQLVLAAEVQDPALAQDFSRLSPALKVVAGKSEAIEQLRRALGDAPRDAPESGEVSPAPFFLIDPKGRLLALFTGKEAPAAIANDLSTLAARPGLLATDKGE
jgi:cytochrome oxidase Cu insertion factor (SCO1/SenC/PrrC family)